MGTWHGLDEIPVACSPDASEHKWVAICDKGKNGKINEVATDVADVIRGP